MIVLITVPIMLLLFGLSAIINYKLGLEEGYEAATQDHRILDICTVYAQDGYTAHEAMEMITEIVLEG